MVSKPDAHSTNLITKSSSCRSRSLQKATNTQTHIDARTQTYAHTENYIVTHIFERTYTKPYTVHTWTTQRQACCVYTKARKASLCHPKSLSIAHQASAKGIQQAKKRMQIHQKLQMVLAAPMRSRKSGRLESRIPLHSTSKTVPQMKSKFQN